MSCAIPAVCVALGLFLQQPARPSWGVILSHDGDFAFSMPATPDLEPAQERGHGGMTGPLRYSCTVGGCEYLLRRVPNPESLEPPQVIQRVARLTADRLGGGSRIGRETSIVVDGVIGHDFTYKVHPTGGESELNRRTRFFVRDRFSYELTV